MRPLKLRPWQKRFLKAVYRTDKKGNRSFELSDLYIAERLFGRTRVRSSMQSP
jgi:hypothetical protein